MHEQLRMTFELLILFQVKHFIADFPLQNNYMVFRKTSPGWDFFLPLLSHSLVHALFTLAIVLAYKPSLWWLAIVDLIIHFTMDRIKSSPRLLGRFDDLGKPIFWWSLGFDQMIHHITHIGLIFFMVVGV